LIDILKKKASGYTACCVLHKTLIIVICCLTVTVLCAHEPHLIRVIKTVIHKPCDNRCLPNYKTHSYTVSYHTLSIYDRNIKFTYTASNKNVLSLYYPIHWYEYRRNCFKMPELYLKTDNKDKL